MTNLNTAIAIQRGWILNPSLISSEYSPAAKWYNPKTNETLWTHDPDFEHDARLYMVLFEEMAEENSTYGNKFYVRKTKIGYEAGKTIGGFDSDYSMDSVLGTAICQAYCKLKGIE